MHNNGKRHLNKLTIIALCIALGACGSRDGVGSGTGSNTHFLRSCDDRNPCSRGLTCECGICTFACDTSESCGEIRADAVCGSVRALSAECPTEATRVCLPPPSDEFWVETSTQCAPLAFARSQQCESEVCVPSRVYVLATADDVNQGLRCGDQGNTSDGCGESFTHFTYEDERVRLRFWYDRSIVGNYSSEQFEKAFGVVSGELHPPTSSELQYTVGNLVLNPGDAGIVYLAYEDGRLKGLLDFGLNDRVYRSIESNEESCYTDDIAGRCACDYFFDQGVSTLVEFDLPVEGAP